MGFIKEPDGIDFIVAPVSITPADTMAIEQAILAYKNGSTDNISSKDATILNSIEEKIADNAKK